MSYQVKAQAREMLIYGDIGPSLWDEQSVQARDVIDALDDIDGSAELTVRINSYGGAVADGLAIYNALKRHPARIVTEIDGYAYSMASLIAMAGDEIRMAENALLMIHAPLTATDGNAQDFREAAEILDRHAEAMASSYTRGGAISRAKVDDWLSGDRDWYFTAAEAQKVGLVDTITEALAVAASGTLADVRGRQREVETMPQANDVEAAKREERQRLIDIDGALAMPSVQVLGAAALAEIRAEALRDGWALGKVHARLLERLPTVNADDGGPITAGAGTPQGSGASGGTAIGDIRMGADAIDKSRKGLTAVLLVRAGLDKSKEAAAELHSNEFAGMTLAEMARHCLVMRGHSIKGLNRMAIVGRALSVRGDMGITHSTSDFPALMENIATKAVLRGWDEAPETWNMIARTGNLPDFKIASRAALNAYPTLPELPENGEFSYATTSDRKNPIVLKRFGSIIGLDRTLIINDDLGELTRIATAQGRAASRTVGDVVYLVLTSNAVMGEDGVPLYDAQHNNIASVAGPPSVETLEEAELLLGLQTDNNANADTEANVTALNIPLQRVIVPRKLATRTRVLQTSTEDPNPSVREGIPNPFVGTFETVSDARLDLVSETAWYASANPNSFDFVEAAFLDGNTTPYLETKDGWTIDGVELKVRIDVGAAPLDFRTSMYNPGA